MITMTNEDFKFVDEQMNDIVRNVKNLSKKSRLNVIEPKIYDKKIENETCRLLSYDFGEKTKDKYNSSVRIRCCGDECNMEFDIITKKEDYQTKDELREMFNIPNCILTEQHSHENTIHNHSLCINHIGYIKPRLQRINELVTTRSVE